MVQVQCTDFHAAFTRICIKWKHLTLSSATSPGILRNFKACWGAAQRSLESQGVAEAEKASGGQGVVVQEERAVDMGIDLFAHTIAPVSQSNGLCARDRSRSRTVKARGRRVWEPRPSGSKNTWGGEGPPARRSGKKKKTQAATMPAYDPPPLRICRYDEWSVFVEPLPAEVTKQQAANDVLSLAFASMGACPEEREQEHQQVLSAYHLKCGIPVMFQQREQDVYHRKFMGELMSYLAAKDLLKEGEPDPASQQSPETRLASLEKQVQKLQKQVSNLQLHKDIINAMAPKDQSKAFQNLAHKKIMASRSASSAAHTPQQHSRAPSRASSAGSHVTSVSQEKLQETITMAYEGAVERRRGRSGERQSAGNNATSSAAS